MPVTVVTKVASISLGLLSSNLASTTTGLAGSIPSGLLPRTDYSTGTGNAPVAVATGAFRADGHQDIVVVNQGTGTMCGPIAIFFGAGDGTFASCTNIPAGVTLSPPIGTLTAVAVGDFNQDGFADIAVTDSTNNRVLILLGNGIYVAERLKAGRR